MITLGARSLPVSTLLFSAAASACVLLLLAGCDTVTEPRDHQVESIVISPGTASMAVGEQTEFSAFAVTAEGDTVDTSDFDVQWAWWSTDPDVFTVDEHGTAVGHSPGEEYCVVEATILVGKRNFTGRDSAFVMIF
jgi:hypothetical protein